MAASASAVRVCPVCGEHSDEPRWWTPKCEAAVASLPEGEG